MRLSDDGIAFIVPGRLDQLTGGYLYDRRIVEGLRERGRAVRVVELSARDPANGAGSPTSPTAPRQSSTDSRSPISLKRSPHRRAACGSSHSSMARWRWKPVFRQLPQRTPPPARPDRSHGSAGSYVRAAKPPLPSRATASLVSGSQSSHPARPSPPTRHGHGAPRYEGCSV